MKKIFLIILSFIAKLFVAVIWYFQANIITRLIVLPVFSKFPDINELWFTLLNIIITFVFPILISLKYKWFKTVLYILVAIYIFWNFGQELLWRF
jgi:hypothetical protein